MVMCGQCKIQMTLIAGDNPTPLESQQFYRCRECGNTVVVITFNKIIKDSGEVVCRKRTLIG